MPVRIYDIAKQLGITSKDVLVKAKELGIKEAKVPSSSLDKITGEFLLEQMGGHLVATPAAQVVHEPIVILAPPVEPEPPAAPVETTSAPIPEPTVAASPEPNTAVADIQPTPATIEPAGSPISSEPPALAAEPMPTPPPAPKLPGLGDKVGFVQLAQKPAPKVGDRPGMLKPPLRTTPDRGPNRFGQRPGTSSAPSRPDSRYGNQPAARSPARPEAPASSDKFKPLETGEMITMKPPIVVRDLAEQLKKKPFQLIADLMELNVFANVNQAIDEAIAQRLCAKHGFRFEVEKRERGGGVVHAPIKKIELDIDDKVEDLVLRPPVVTIMGHVDHGKTSLLDVIRKANVAASEAGGITQHIGAYTITFPHPERPKELQQITFLDTPGHAAFSAMRARGANVTDIVILVVAANDGVMPQTLEALSHAQAAAVPIIVAVNKCDHPNANPMKVRQQLQDKGLVCEEWGGNTIFQDVSALTKQGVDKLLELILLQAEIMELKANPKRRAKGNVVESGLEPGGPTATVLVRKGTLRVGDLVICGQYYGKVRALINEENKRLKEAAPSVAVRILGMNGVPEAGLEFSVVENEKQARNLAEERAMAARELDNVERRPKVTLENLFATMDSTTAKVLKVVVKADTQGSVEAIVEALRKIVSDKVSIEVIHYAVGTITESDVLLASASKAIVLGFHTRIDNSVSEVAKREGVQIKLYTIIYELVDQVKDAMAGLLDPLTKEVVAGAAEVRQVFELSKGGNVAGCIVNSGRIVKGKVRVMRRKGLIYEGVTLSLRRFQDEVNEVRSGMECGIRVDGFNEFQVGDSIECYTFEKIKQTL